MSLIGQGFDPNVPDDGSDVDQGAFWIRDIKQRLKDFVSVSFDPDTGVLKASATNSDIPLPIGPVGSVLTSNGPDLPLGWKSSAAAVVGSTWMYGGGIPPDGYLLCNGQIYQISDYPLLAAVVGFQFGGNGTTTFGVPDFRGRLPVGRGKSDTARATVWSVGDKRGAEQHAVTLAEYPTHYHSVYAVTWIPNFGKKGSTARVLSKATMVKTFTSPGARDKTWDYYDKPNLFVRNTGVQTMFGTAHENVQPSIGLTFIIKY